MADQGPVLGYLGRGTIEYENVLRVTITGSRWNAQVKIEFNDGGQVVYVASADSYYTEGDGIYFADYETYLED